jgi:hypothetical protein
MLINIFAQPKDDILNWKLPIIHLDRKFNYKVGMTMMNFELQNSAGIRENEIFCLNSNLLDLTAMNANQTIGHLAFHAKHRIQHKECTIVLYQLLQIYEMDNVTFELRHLSTNTIAKLKHIFIQLEIKRLDTYGRV